MRYRIDLLSYLEKRSIATGVIGKKRCRTTWRHGFWQADLRAAPSLALGNDVSAAVCQQVASQNRRRKKRRRVNKAARFRLEIPRFKIAGTCSSDRDGRQNRNDPDDPCARATNHDARLPDDSRLRPRSHLMEPNVRRRYTRKLPGQ